jgi:hypothetical protein
LPASADLERETSKGATVCSGMREREGESEKMEKTIGKHAPPLTFESKSKKFLDRFSYFNMCTRLPD